LTRIQPQAANVTARTSSTAGTLAAAAEKNGGSDRAPSVFESHAASSQARSLRGSESRAIRSATWNEMKTGEE